MSHQCPAKGCDKQVDDVMLMCRTHWHQLTRAEKAAVWNSYDMHGPGPTHIGEIQPIIKALNDRNFPPRNQGKPFGL